eukprot:augustus_masked-scaffold_4-processed-gene-13.10-mRNA-1 protein AED:0.70 eAED:0.70 QI:0/0/0/0.25/1/1/8/0/1008
MNVNSKIDAGYTGRIGEEALIELLYKITRKVPSSFGLSREAIRTKLRKTENPLQSVDALEDLLEAQCQLALDRGVDALTGQISETGTKPKERKMKTPSVNKVKSSLLNHVAGFFALSTGVRTHAAFHDVWYSEIPWSTRRFCAYCKNHGHGMHDCVMFAAVVIKKDDEKRLKAVEGDVLKTPQVQDFINRMFGHQASDPEGRTNYKTNRGNTCLKYSAIVKARMMNAGKVSPNESDPRPGFRDSKALALVAPPGQTVLNVMKAMVPKDYDLMIEGFDEYPTIDVHVGEVSQFRDFEEGYEICTTSGNVISDARFDSGTEVTVGGWWKHKDLFDSYSSASGKVHVANDAPVNILARQGHKNVQLVPHGTVDEVTRLILVAKSLQDGAISVYPQISIGNVPRTSVDQDGYFEVRIIESRLAPSVNLSKNPFNEDAWGYSTAASFNVYSLAKQIPPIRIYSSVGNLELVERINSRNYEGIDFGEIIKLCRHVEDIAYDNLGDNPLSEVEEGLNLENEEPLIRRAIHEMIKSNFIRDKLLSMAERGLVTKVKSTEFESVVFAVQKKGNKLRMVVNLVDINNILRRDVNQLPHLETCFDDLSGSKYYGSLNVVSGFDQLGIIEEAKKYFNIVSEHGTFQLQFAPMGYHSTPEFFHQRMVDKVARASGTTESELTAAFRRFLKTISITAKQKLSLYDRTQDLLLVIDASDMFFSLILMQADSSERDKKLLEKRVVPMMFFSGKFQDSQGGSEINHGHLNRLQRWVLTLQQADVELNNVKGEDNVFAYMLSGWGITPERENHRVEAIWIMRAAMRRERSESDVFLGPQVSLTSNEKKYFRRMFKHPREVRKNSVRIWNPLRSKYSESSSSREGLYDPWNLEDGISHGLRPDGGLEIKVEKPSLEDDYIKLAMVYTESAVSLKEISSWVSAQRMKSEATVYEEVNMEVPRVGIDIIVSELPLSPNKQREKLTFERMQALDKEQISSFNPYYEGSWERVSEKELLNAQKQESLGDGL